MFLERNWKNPENMKYFSSVLISESAKENVTGKAKQAQAL